MGLAAFNAMRRRKAAEEAEAARKAKEDEQKPAERETPAPPTAEPRRSRSRNA